jgi:formylglycine-generating enzyme required for sulfatase activity
MLLGWVLLLGLAAEAGAGPLPAVGTSFRDCLDVCPEMVVIPAGSYAMGSSSGDPHQAPDTEEQPQHRVTMGHPLAVGRFEITRQQWAAFVRDAGLADPPGCNAHQPPNWPKVLGASWHDPGFAQTANDPAVCLSWDEATSYAAWLSRKTGHAYRLLSEAEWEYAARAGSQNQNYWGDSQDTACLYANGPDVSMLERFPEQASSEALRCRDGYIYTAPVGSFRPNPFGLYDMMGNVFEWVQDCWVSGYRDAPVDGSPRLEKDCQKRVNRGGSWTDIPTGIRAAQRGHDGHATRVYDLGFRVARTG